MQSHQGNDHHRYLQLGDLRRLEQMLFAPRKLVAGRFAGQYQTRQLGQSVEFRDYREYLPGDEIGAVDWKVYGRTDKLYIRLFEHQSELTVQLLVDASASMAYAGLQPFSRRVETKFDYASRLAAAIAFLVLKQHDRCALGIARQGLAKLVPAAGSLRQLTSILNTLEDQPRTGPAGLAAAIDALSRSGSRKAILVVLSDLLDDVEGTVAALAARVRSGGEAVLFHVLHPDELQLPEVESGTFIDSESGDRVRLSVNEVRSEYAHRMEQFLKTWEARSRSLGIDYIRAVMSEPYHRVIERYLIGRSSRGRV